MTDEKILEYIEWCKRQKLSYKETMALFEDSHGFEIRKRAEAIWQRHFGLGIKKDHTLSDNFENETNFSKPDNIREIIAKIFIAIGIVAVLIIIVLIVFGKGKYSIRTDKNPESGINCLASNVRVLQPVTSSGENDQMTMMN